ncbi:cellulase family glycosylhydrolase [Collinsella sp. zg1085]|uniref:glycoside hydrolase family 5 protein n=1 Tax=Collinsella sp. zg1085 TaxID=2844380 RepID=UPI001C0D2F92|nr:cellulase family glycosylhydrolase [Collinsella sp. zg1085]QWT17456.1 cellulase family glycosylhydrolase [Collinsella sp. zg1085]
MDSQTLRQAAINRVRLRRRKQKLPAYGQLRGANLSGWLIPEPWVCPTLFEGTGASTEQELQQALGTTEYNERLRQHLESFITEADFRRMALIGLNAVRIPVPWYAFGVQSEGKTYIPLIDYIDRAFEWANQYEIAVILTLATVPGGQGDAHEPTTAPNYIAEWHASHNGRYAALEVLEKLAIRYGEDDALAGIELLDAPVMRVRQGLFAMSDGIPIHYLRNYYRDAYARIRAHMPASKAIIFSDSGHPERWRGFMRGSTYENIMIDVHVYHYRDQFAQDITSPKGIVQAIVRTKASIELAQQTGFPVLVGEWSGAAVLSSSRVTPEGRAAYERVFIANQLSAFKQCAGWFFQTWKTEKRIPAWDARVALGTLERAMLE